MDDDDDTITLPSGRKLDPNGGIVGIGSDLNVSEGWDGDLAFDSKWSDGEEILPEDRKALADLMIERWKAFAAL